MVLLLEVLGPIRTFASFSKSRMILFDRCWDRGVFGPLSSGTDCPLGVGRVGIVWTSADCVFEAGERRLRFVVQWRAVSTKHAFRLLVCLSRYSLSQGSCER